MNNLLFPFIVFVVAASSFSADPFTDYIARPESEYRWELRSKSETPDGTLYNLHFTSQVWQEIRWEHELQVFRPKKVEFPACAMLLITGGNPRPDREAYGFRFANAASSLFVTLYNVPNQPLFGTLKEDDLIAHTFTKTIETKDPTWPLLLPMTKSAVKAMDVVQAFAQQEWKEKLDGFVVTGASKRGWTTWLTAAHDKRVKAIAPMVYDNLNLTKQMPHQLESFGGYSEKIEDYTRRQLQTQLATEEGKKLSSLVDPYTYRDRLTMPKLILNGTNDRYWALDSLNFYWSDLPGEKLVLYVPNAGHDLRDDLNRRIASIVAFYRQVAGKQELPKLKWMSSEENGKLRLTVQAASAVKQQAALWVARSNTKDFRDAKWESSSLSGVNDAIGDVTYNSWVDKPATGYFAFFAELTFEQNGQPYYLSTQIQIIGAKP